MEPFTLAALKAEIGSDPLVLGYAALTARGDVRGLADALNKPRDSIRVNRGVISRDEFTGDFFAVFEAVRQLGPGAIRDKWEWRIDRLFSMKDTVDLSSPNMAAMLAELKADGLVTDAQSDSLVNSATSRAEQLWGQTVTAELVAEALYRT